MLKMNAPKGGTDFIGQFLFRERTVWFDNTALTMSPLGFNRIEPGALDRQETTQNTNTFSAALDTLIVFSDPCTHSFAGMPASIVPNHRQDRLTQNFKLCASPVQELDGDVTHRASIHKAQQHFLNSQFVCFHPTQQDAITGQGFGVRIIFLLDLFHQAQRLLFFAPTRQIRLSKTAPPNFILETPYPSVALRQSNYSIARLFLRTYSGSGLVIQCLARFHETFKRFNAKRTLSPLIKRGVSPSAKLTSATNSSVQTLVSLPNSRGLWCSRALKCSVRSASKVACAVFGRLEPIRRLDIPRSLNATMAFRTVWSLQFSISAMRGTHSPRALARIIWLRRTEKGLVERNPVLSAWRSVSISSRTKIGFLMQNNIPLSRLSVSGSH